MVLPAEGHPHSLRAPKQTRGETHQQTRGCGHGRSFHDAHDACSAWILDAVPDGILSIDPHGRVLSINRQVERLFGYRREELVGQSITKVFSCGQTHRVGSRRSRGATATGARCRSTSASAHRARRTGCGPCSWHGPRRGRPVN